MAEALAVDAGLPQTMLEGVAYIVDISEFRRDLLDRRVRWAANLEPSCAKYSNILILVFLSLLVFFISLSL